MIKGYFSERLLKSLPDDTTEGLGLLAKEFFRYNSTIDFELDPDSVEIEICNRIEDLRGIAAIFRRYSEHYGEKINFPKLTGDNYTDSSAFHQFLQSTASEWRKKRNLHESLQSIQKHTETVDGIISGNTSYAFSDEEYDRVQTLINELRDAITSSEHLQGEHKLRLKKALEKVQSELHKNCSNIDSVWLLVIRFREIVQAGGDPLPTIASKMTELAKIAFAAHVIGKCLPGGNAEGLADLATKLLK